MKRKLFLLAQVFLASMAAVVNAQTHTFSEGKTYKIESNNNSNKYMQDNGNGRIDAKTFNANSVWYLIPTSNDECYYVQNATTGNYMQTTKNWEKAVETGENPVEIYIKNDDAKGTNVFGLASTDREPHDFTSDETYGANYNSGEGGYVQGYNAMTGAGKRPNSFWKITEVKLDFSPAKIYTIVCKPDFNTFMQDNGTSGLLLGAESAGTLWKFEPTGKDYCYNVKNVKTGNYIQACPDLEDENNPQPVLVGATSVEYYIKGDESGDQAGENFYRMTSTNRSPNNFSTGTIGLNRAGDNTKVQGFKSVSGANQWSVWCIREVEKLQPVSLSSPFTGSEVQEGTIYLYNVESGKWLQSNNRFNPDLTNQYWTTRAELGDWGLDLQLTAQDGGYQINPKFGNKHSINDYNLYMDTDESVTSWKFKSKSVAGVSNAYTIEAEKATLGSDINGYLRGADLGATTWQVVTREERIQYAQQNATAQNPIDVTFLVNNPDLANNNERTAWSVTRDGGSDGWNDNARYNRNFYASGFNSIDVSQAEIVVPNGTYQVCFSLMYSPTALGDINIDDYNAYKTNGNETVYVVGYANGETIKARSIYSVEGTSNVSNEHQKQVGDYFFPNGPNQVNGTMAIGNYQTEPLTVTVSNGKLTLGVKSIEGCPTTAYVGFNGIKLTYIGATVTVSDAKYATFVAPFDVDFSGAEVSAYAAQVNPTSTYVHLEPVTTVPEGTAVVVKAEAAGTYALDYAPSAALDAENDLVAATEDITADGTQYALAQKSNVVGFYQVNSDVTIPAGKAYLVVSGEGEVKAFYGFEEDEATSIQTIDNGQWTTDGAIYNLAGQRISKMQKGINIINGKKVLY